MVMRLNEGFLKNWFFVTLKTLREECLEEKESESVFHFSMIRIIFINYFKK